MVRDRIHDRIRDSYPTFSPSYGRVADFILANYVDVAFMTATQLAAAVAVDTTTVVRFAQHLDFKGYPALLDAIRQEVRAEIHAAREPQPAAEAEQTGDSSAAARVHARLAAEQAALAHGISPVHNRPQAIEAAVALLADADRFFFVAEGETTPIAMLTAQLLGQWGCPVVVVSGSPKGRATALAQLGQGDLLIGLGASTSDEMTARAMHFARSVGCPVLAVVGDLSSPLNQAADRVIYAPGAGAIPLLAVVNALVWVACGPESERGNAGSERVARVARFLAG